MTSTTSFSLTISFRKSASRNYGRALEIASKLRNFKPISSPGASNSIVVSAEEFREEIDRLEDLMVMIKSWRGTEYLLDGTSVPYYRLESIRAIFRCSSIRSRTSSSDRHCRRSEKDEEWGCRFLDGVQPGIPAEPWMSLQGRCWFSFGYFETPRVWVIEKERIKDALRREAESKKLSLCAHYSFDRALEHLAGLPDRIDLDASKEWVVKREVGSDGRVMEEKPVTIEPASWSGSRPSCVNMSYSLADYSSRRGPAMSKARVIPDVRFEEVGGIDEILQKVREVIELPMEQPELFKHLGIRPHRGVLLYGPPGCGKTLIAKAIANEIKAHFIAIRGPELLSKWHGESEQNLRDVFDEAILLKPSIILFDEIDALAQRRTSSEIGRIEARFVNQLLTLMDGIEDTSGICVIATTNRPDLLDEALLRPGRFDYTLEVQKPNAAGCRRILEIHTRKMPLDHSVDLAAFSSRLVGLSGADIAYLIREAGYCCIRRLTDAPALLNSDALTGEQLSSFVINGEDLEQALRSFEDKASDAASTGPDDLV
jgi:hypothetical protein